MRYSLAFFALLATNGAIAAQPCSYYAAGDLIPGTGQGADDDTIYDATMAFPLKDGLGTTKSAVYSPGGRSGGDQCDPSNFNSINRDTFCETRPGVRRESLNCPSVAIHQGIDIHGGTSDTCKALVAAKRAIKAGADPSEADIVPVVAVQDGVVTYIGSYTVDLRAGPRKYRYLHMNMKTLNVKQGQQVSKGDTIGFMYNDFGGAATIFHLHFEMYANINRRISHVSPYLSLVKSLGVVAGQPCTLIKDNDDSSVPD